MRDEELRTRLQALATAVRQEPEASTLAAVRRRGRGKLRNALVLTVIGALVVAGGLRLLPDRDHDRGTVLAPGAVPPPPLVGLSLEDGRVRLALLDPRTGRLRRWLPGAAIRGLYTVSPDLRKLYLYQRGKDACPSAWTEVDLTTGAERPAFGGRRVGLSPVPSPDGRYVAFTSCPGPGQGLAVLDVASGRVRTWTVPEQAELLDWPLQWSPDSTRLGYLLRRHRQAAREFHALPLQGTTSVAQGRALVLSHRPGCELVLPPRFRGDGRLLVVEQCPDDTFLVDYDLGTGRKLARVALGLRTAVADVAVDRSGANLLLLTARRDRKVPPSLQLVRKGRAEPLANGCGCWQVAW